MGSVQLGVKALRDEIKSDSNESDGGYHVEGVNAAAHAA
jgi:hypothetical protein